MAPRTFSRAQRTPIVQGMMAFVLILVVLQLWLLTATMNAYLGGDDSIVWPAALASLACFALNAGLLRYLRRLEKTRA
jgi:divalent metal cation (Fe/Co/Zn/Cd) transporter